MKKILNIFLFSVIASGCSSKVGVKKVELSKGSTIEYIETVSNSFEKVWSSLTDWIASNAMPVDRLDKENGLYVSGEMPIGYMFEGQPAQTRLEPVVTLPKLVYEEVLGKSVLKSRTVFPDEITGQVYVRVKPETAGSSKVIVKVGNVKTKGAHYKVKYVDKDTKDTTETRVPVTTLKDWSGWVSTGRLEKKVIEAIR